MVIPAGDESSPPLTPHRSTPTRPPADMNMRGRFEGAGITIRRVPGVMAGGTGVLASLRAAVAIACVATALAAGPVAAERLPVRLFTTDDGLPRDQLTCVHTDARGFVWFCTADGLVRFDGHNAVTFGRDAGLDPPRVRAFTQTSNGQYWAGTDIGLVEFTASADGALHHFVRVPRADGRPTGWINTVTESRDHLVWCGGSHGLFRMTAAGDADRLVAIDIGLTPNATDERIVRALAADEHGTLWVGASSGLYARRVDGRIQRIVAKDGLPVDDVRALALEPGGRLWVATRDGLALVDRRPLEHGAPPRVLHVYRPEHELPHGAILSLFRADESLWVGTSLGVTELVAKSSDDVQVGRQLSGQFSWGMASDLRGNLWIATQAGATRLARDGFTSYSQEDGLATPRVASVVETPRGEICVTTLVLRIQVNCFDGRRFRAVPIRALQTIDDQGWGWSQLTLQDRRGRWWIPTGRGLLRFRPGLASSLASAMPELILDSHRGLSSDNIFRLFEDSGGGVWVSTFAESGSGLARVDPATDSLHVFSSRDGLPALLPIVHAFAEDHAGGIWIGLDEGRLLRYRDGRFAEILAHDRPMSAATDVRPEDEVRSLIVDRRGRLWVASTTAGLGRIDDPEAERPNVRWYGTDQGLSSNTAWMLVADGPDDLFVGTSRGVDRVNAENGSVIHYTAADGIPRGEIKGALRDRRGGIWFATTDGVARLAPVRRAASLAPLTLVTAVRVGGISLPIPADGAVDVPAVDVAPGDRRVEIDFVSPGHREADGLRYQHQLEGIDRDWTTTDARTVAIAGAAPGTYRFLVRAMLANGVASKPARVEFTVLAPIWRRWWFIAMAGAGVAVVALAFHRTRVRQLLEVERVRSRIAADLHDNVGASLSRIAILSEVVRRQAEDTLPAVVPEIASIADNAREVIDQMSDAVWFIDPRLDTVQHIAVRIRAIAASLFDHVPILWTLEVDDDVLRVPLTPEQRRHLYLIAKESLTNIARHAHASHVVVRLTAADRLRLEVIDDGIGMLEHAGSGTGRGLANMRARAAAAGGDVRIALAAQGRGTRIVFEAPL
jgi:ligand-binding sensor domain-containing protein/signal transduction histidine kinase